MADSRGRTVRSLFGGAFIAVLIGELVSRRVSFAPRSFDVDLGFVVSNGGTTHSELEGSATGHWGARGVRQDPHAHRGESVAPILVVGDSETEAKEVNDDEVYTSVARAEMVRAGVDVPILNIGTAGLRTPIYVANAPAYQRVFQQRWAVVAINDDDLTEDMFVDNASYFTGGTQADPLQLHVVPPGGGGGLRLRYRQLRAQSALVQLAVLQGIGFSTDVKNSHLFHASPENTRPAHAPASSFPIAAALTQLKEAFAGRLTILFISSFDGRHPEASTDVEAEVSRFCKETETSCVFGREDWRSFADAGRAPFGFPNGQWNVGHPNAEGHAALGRVLGRELLRLRQRGLL